MHRIQWFDDQVRQGKYPNSAQLAKQFEISRRQAQRDIEYLTFSLRAPLLYVAQQRGYCYEDKMYALPLLYITDEEKKVLKYLAYRYHQYNYDNAAAVHRIAHLLDRFTDEAGIDLDTRLPIFEASPALIQNVELLTHAIKHQLVVTISYADQDEDESLLRICPVKLFAKYNSDYIEAFCWQDNNRRSFRLDCISHVTVTSEPFELPSDQAGSHKQDSAPARKPFTAKIRLAQPISGSAWHGYRIQSSQDLIYTLEFYDTDSFLQHLFSSDWEELLAPKWLKEKLTGRCQHIRDRLHERE
ncbi:helix-turn-helix transcriptional regulator [Paenibacillus solisilvae]|uniref:Helix-turn-helix transcriptional regulator n=1 Tax=Paenibacillus solisilvae TaxID=2486751 RepID=A0ABW0VWS9_9BACL